MCMYDEYSSLIWISSFWFGTGTKCDLIKPINGIPTVPWVNDCLIEMNYFLMSWWCLFYTYQHAVSCIIIMITHWTINSSPKTACCSILDTLFWLKSSSYYCCKLVSQNRHCQYYSLWLDPTGNQSHNLPHLKWVICQI
jgi:hypothetical protein